MVDAQHEETLRKENTKSYPVNVKTRGTETLTTHTKTGERVETARKSQLQSSQHVNKKRKSCNHTQITTGSDVSEGH